MSETTHPAERLHQAEIALEIAEQRTAEMAEKHSPWQYISPRRMVGLSGNLSILANASKLCGEAGADPQSPLVSAIRTLHDRTQRQRRNLLAAYAVIATALVVLGVIFIWATGKAPFITYPEAGEAVSAKISVRGSSPRGSLPSGSHLYVLVKPIGYTQPLDYWLQPTPNVSLTGWRADGVGIGIPGDEGKHFLICAVLTGETLSTGWHFPDPPAGESHCIDVIRN